MKRAAKSGETHKKNLVLAGAPLFERGAAVWQIVGEALASSLDVWRETGRAQALNLTAGKSMAFLAKHGTANTLRQNLHKCRENSMIKHKAYLKNTV